MTSDLTEQWADAERDVECSLRSAKSRQVSAGLISLFEAALTAIRAKQGKPPLEGARRIQCNGQVWRELEVFEQAVCDAIRRLCPQDYGLNERQKSAMIERCEGRILLYRQAQHETLESLLEGVDL